MVGDALDDQIHGIAEQSDVKEALLRGGIWGPTRDGQIAGLSMILTVSEDSAHAVVVREGDFLAEAAIVGRTSNAAVNTFRDLLGHDPDDGWFGALERRHQVTSVLNTLVPPFCLVMWKTQASDRLSQSELAALRVELLRVVSGVAFELLERIRQENRLRWRYPESSARS